MRIRLADMNEDVLYYEHSDKLIEKWWNERERRPGQRDDALIINRPNWMPMENSL